jgi:hypothetical protein
LPRHRAAGDSPGTLPTLATRGPRWRWWLVAASWSVPFPSAAEPLPSSDFQLDLFQGPLLAPLRVTALGGAYAGYGEELAAMVSNAASPSVRAVREVRHIEFGASGSISIPIDLFENNDFDNSGDRDSDYSDFIYATGGLNLKIGALGLGAVTEIQAYDIATAPGETAPITFTKTRAQIAYGALGDQVNVGLGVRAITMGIETQGREFVFAGAAPELGILVKPELVPFRFGATYRLETRAGQVTDGRPPAGLRLPQAVVQPWELEAGLSFQLGPRPFNVVFVDPEDRDDGDEARIAAARLARQRDRQRAALMGEVDDAALDEELEQLEDEWLERNEQRLLDRRDDVVAAYPREHVLVLMSLVTTGPVDQGVSIASFLSQADPAARPRVGSSGAAVNFSPRFGIEAEPIPHWLFVRAGSYYEPNRFGGVGRQHFTFGSALRVFSTSFWGLLPEYPYGVEFGMDLAPRYESVSLSVLLYR